MGFVIYAAGLAIIFISGRSFSVPALYGMLSFTVLVYLLCPERRVSSAGVRVAGAGLGCDAVVRTPARAHLEMAGASAK
jgi:hypothetical protein